MNRSEIELRILGCLIEKEMTTPDYYPLTLNALTHACNQKSNRHPVAAYIEAEVLAGLDGLRENGLVMRVLRPGDQVPKFQHVLREKLPANAAELAILAELMLRGPQTAGELRGRADRLFRFESAEEMAETLEVLMNREPPLATRLPRQSGQKESRYAHRLGAVSPSDTVPEDAAAALPVDRLTRLEDRVRQIHEEVIALRAALEKFQKQFE